LRRHGLRDSCRLFVLAKQQRARRQQRHVDFPESQ
jgi:hypothetical protein